MIRLIVLILGFICSVSCQTNWVSKAKLENGDQYFVDVMQETFYEVERRGWSNLRLLDFTQNINSQMYGWLVAGTVTYRNGFLVSIQKIDLDRIRSTFYTRTVNNETQTIGAVLGRINLNDAMIGYDVVANLSDVGVQHFTGTFLHTVIQLVCRIEMNVNTKVITTIAREDSVSGGQGRMRYLPASNITEVISRSYIPSSIWEGVDLWGINTLAPVMKDIATNKLEFPSVCFNC